MRVTGSKAKRTPVPASRLSGLRPYLRAIAERNIDLWLDANEGSPGGSAPVDVAQIPDPKVLSRYPRATELEGSIAERLGVEPSRVLVTNGGDDAIDRVCRAIIEPGRTGLIHSPTFEMIERGIRLAGGSVEQVEWVGGSFPIESMLDRISEEASLVAVVTPNNPTGSAIDRPSLMRIVERTRETGAVLLLDLAYIEFAEDDPTGDLLGEDHVVIVRTFSKAFGMAGLRVGYAVASDRIALWLRTVGGPYPVSQISLELARNALQRGTTEQVQRVIHERNVFTQMVTEIGASAVASEANFVLVSPRSARGFQDGLADRGIAVRGFSSDSPVSDRLRITMPGEPRSFQRLCDAWREIASGGEEEW